MCRFMRYGVTHCMRAAMARLQELRGEATIRSSMRALDLLSRVSLLVAICLGIYARWEISQEANMLIIFVLALVVLGLAIALHCYFHMEKVSQSLIHLWRGSLLGLLCFVGSPALDHGVKEQTTNYLLLTSMVLRTLWALLERICGCAKYRPAFLTTAERMELVGFGVVSFVVSSSPSVAVFVGALAVLMVVFRVKAVLTIPDLVVFAFVFVFAGEFLFIKGLDVSNNQFALACFLSQLMCDPLLDCYFSVSSVTERWQPFLAAGRWRRLSLLPLLLVVEVTFLVLAASKLSDGGPLYLMIPAFVVCMLFWGIIHLVFLITLWGFHTKISACQRVCLAQGSGFNSLDKVMASKGVRHFCLISQSLVQLTLLSTLMMAVLAWMSVCSLSISVSLLVLLLESLFHGLFHELGNSLGGTCVGYAVVIPTNSSLDGQPMLLPPDQVQQLNQRSMDMLNKVKLFFDHHMIGNFGCDYSTSGLSLEAMQAKLCSFLEQRTAEGPRHDTYVVYYSGHTHRTGEWALAGGDTLQLDQIVKWWREKNAGACSRLILVVDVENALPWTKEAGRVKDSGLYVAVQGATLSPASYPEVQDAGQLGDFTHRWVVFNCNPGADIHWSEPGRPVSAVYGVSHHWGDYSLHLPTEGDVHRHWQTYFPRVTYPVVRQALWACGLDVFWGCGVFQRYLRRLKLNWFPPAILDTGQGFKLVRS
ncbi:transmembrane protein 168-like [Gadus chalcogrammus]|uniref:transmembrane protein 168-like n=1 Tax=Gadus chalcogrammus TaxID=1042646 RepID=UPI0024C4D98B|nr:transmembrane protein 168-like [Gadus chalcogrammus]